MLAISQTMKIYEILKKHFKEKTEDCIDKV
jgi:hypothetical protein